MILDLNCDLGEGMTTDTEVIPWITSANIACCMHAGDPRVALHTLQRCRTHQVTVGAHPGYSDREHFGRIDRQLTTDELRAELIFQLHGLIQLARSFEIQIKYIKPHGALYNQACRQDDVASIVAWMSAELNLPLLGLPNSRLELAAHSHPGLGYFREGFADRRYLPDGSLVPRQDPNAFVHDPQEAIEQVEWLVRERGVRSICVHGDNPQAVEFVRRLREALLSQGHTIQAFA